jgi:hypothetical protein
MSLPFTTDQFMDVFVRYNEAVWPMQWVLNGVALLCVVLLFFPRAWTNRVISLVLAGMWLWMALAYHLAFFAPLNRAAWWFGMLFLLGGMAFDWFGVVGDKLRFHASLGTWQLIGAMLMLFALVIYPAISYAVGRRYPAMPTFGLPCPTTIFTIGLLLFAEAPIPRTVFAVPILSAGIGSLVAFWLGVTEDLTLLIAGAIGVAAVLDLHRASGLTVRSDVVHPVRS